MVDWGFDRELKLIIIENSNEQEIMEISQQQVCVILCEDEDLKVVLGGKENGMLFFDFIVYREGEQVVVINEDSRESSFFSEYIFQIRI